MQGSSNVGCGINVQVCLPRHSRRTYSVACAASVQLPATNPPHSPAGVPQSANFTPITTAKGSGQTRMVDKPGVLNDSPRESTRTQTTSEALPPTDPPGVVFASVVKISWFSATVTAVTMIEMLPTSRNRSSSNMLGAGDMLPAR